MKCDHCDKPAVVHEVVIKAGTTREVHLCAEHAAQKGYQVPTVPVTQLLAQFAGAVAPVAPRGASTGTACPACGLAFAEFRQTGVLGCANCYEAFMPQIGNVIERAQAGAVHHVGRVPRHLEGSAERAAMLPGVCAGSTRSSAVSGARPSNSVHGSVGSITIFFLAR